MHVKKIITKFLSCTLATIVMMSAFVVLGSVTKTDVASALVWSYDTNGTASNDDDTIFFRSDVNDAADGTLIINCLGYFISVYDENQRLKGTVFVTNTTNGHSYYHYNTAGQNDGVSIPVSHIKAKINSEYAGTETRGNMLDALNSTFYMVLDSLITPSVKGNDSSCAYTLRDTNVTAREVLTAYTHLLNDPSATANGSAFWAPLAIQRNRGSSSKYTSSCFCLSASSSIFADSTRISEIGFSPSFSESLYYINWDGTNGNGSKGHADDGGNFVKALGYKADTQTATASGYFAIPAGKGNGQPNVIATDLKATDIKFKLTSTGAEVSEPLREYEKYTPIYQFYNDGPACTATLTGTNNTTGQTITVSNVSIGEKSYYSFDGEPFIVQNSMFSADNTAQDYTWDSMSISFTETGTVNTTDDLDTSNNTRSENVKFAIANPTNVINASTYEKYSENYTGYGSSQNNNLYTGLVNLKETSTSGNAPINGKYSVTDGTVSITSNNTPDCAVVIPGYAYLTEGTVYKFSMETNGDWCTTEDHVNSEKIEAWLFPEDATDLSNGFTVDIDTDITYGFSVETEGYGFNMMKKLDDGSYLLACRKTGKYRIRLDANMSPGTITFSDIRIEEYGTTTYLGSFDNVQYWSSAENHTHYVSNGKLYMETGVNADGNVAFFDDTQVAPVTLIEGQEYVINVDTDCPVWDWTYTDTVQFYLACNGGYADNTIAITDAGNYGGLGKFINPVQIGENTFKITCQQTAKYYWRFDVNGPYTTHWFAPPEIYNITEREQINISGENLYTGFKNATLPTVTYGEIRIPADTVIHNGVATVINSNTEIRQVTEIGKSQEAYFYDTTGSARLIAGHKYIFQCETNGIWAITGEGLENSVGLQESLHNADNVSAYLIKLDDSGNIMLGDNSMITLGDTNNSNWVCMTKVSENTFMFTPKVTGNYILRLDVNKMGKTYWFKNPKIYNVTVHESNYPSSNKDYIDLTNIKLNTVSGKIYSGQQVRFSSETQSLSMFNAKYATELSAKGLSPTSFMGSIINRLFNPFSGSFTPAFAKWETTLSDDGRAKYTNESGLGAVDVTATSYETSIIGKYSGRDNEFKQTSTKRYDVYPTDLEAVSVKVYDTDTGKKITTAKDGQKVKVEYVYTNNTQLPVFATVMYTGNVNKTFSSPTVSVDTGVTEIEANDYTPLLGDANGDGTIDIFDRIKITKAVGSVASEGDVKDVNLDGKITNADANIINGYIVGNDAYVNEYNILKNRYDSYCWHTEDIILSTGETYTITKEYIVSSKDYSTFKPEGRIYIKDLNFNTEYEYEGENNIANTTVSVKSPFSGEIVNINSKYRKSKTVITSVEVSNSSLYEMGNTFYTDIYGTIDAEMKVYDNAECEGKPIAIAFSDTDICVPEDNRDTTLVWFKWTVPTKCPDKLYAKIVLDSNHNYSSAEFVDNGSNSKNFGAIFAIETPKVYNTPDTTFAKDSPYWFKDTVNKGISAPSSYISFYEGTEEITDTLSWEYYIPGTVGIEKIKETATLKGSAVNLVPDGNDSAYINYDFRWTMKSGYGFKIETEFKDNGEHCTGVQSGFSVFPEFTNMMATSTSRDLKNRTVNFYTNTSLLRSGFENVNGKKPTSGGNYATFATLETNYADSFRFPNNESSKSATHFVPIWFPQSEYRTTSYFADAWTPAGMLSSKILSSAIEIEGNMYDDYVIEKK